MHYFIINVTTIIIFTLKNSGDRKGAGIYPFTV